MFALSMWIIYEFPMNRLHLCLLYAAVWVFTIWLFYNKKPQGGGSLGMLAIYGLPVFVLYLLSLFLVDVREPALDASMVKQFLKRRQVSIGLFFFGLVVLILLLSFTS